MFLNFTLKIGITFTLHAIKTYKRKKLFHDTRMSSGVLGTAQKHSGAR